MIRHTRRADLDHIEPYDEDGPPGQTKPENLAPLCRRHHRAKTSPRWRYERLPDGSYRWHAPGIRLTGDTARHESHRRALRLLVQPGVPQTYKVRGAPGEFHAQRCAPSTELCTFGVDPASSLLHCAISTTDSLAIHPTLAVETRLVAAAGERGQCGVQVLAVISRHQRGHPAEG